LLRVYGPQVEHLIDRDAELLILKRLARKNIGPRLLGTFKNGRFEQYLSARTLTPEDLRKPETFKQIAKRMRELHDGIELLDRERDAGPFVWQNWDKWVSRCGEVITWVDEQILAGKGPVSPTQSWKRKGLVCGVEWAKFRKAVEMYRKWLTKQYGGERRIKSQLVFAHNDVSYQAIFGG
jgi:choline kinase